MAKFLKFFVEKLVLKLYDLILAKKFDFRIYVYIQVYNYKAIKHEKQKKQIPGNINVVCQNFKIHISEHLYS